MPPVAVKGVDEPMQIATFEPPLTAGKALTVTLIVVDAVVVPFDTMIVKASVPLYPVVGV